MINVGIVGSVSAIGRHISTLNHIEGVHINGCWISGGPQDSVKDYETGNLCTEPGLILEKSEALILSDGGSFTSRLSIAALRKARHVFIYPAAVHSVSEAYHLIQLAREANVILKCGRAGTAGIQGLIKMLPDLQGISMIDYHHYRKIGSPGSSATAEALLADLEIINRLVQARVISIKAKGLSMLSSQPEILTARLEFDNGCAVNYNGNLVAAQNEFLITIVVRNKILKYNFLSGELTVWDLQPANNQNESPIFIESLQVEHSDSQRNDLSDFFAMIHSGPALSMHDNGFESYLLTDRILEKVMKTLIRCA